MIYNLAPAKPKRKRISQEQFQALSELFEQTDTPNYELREKLALKLNMTNREVQVIYLLFIIYLFIFILFYLFSIVYYY